MNDTDRWFVGVDWAPGKHDLRITDGRGTDCGGSSFPHSGSGLAAMADWILEVTGASPGDIGVAIEVPHGPVVEALMEHGFRVHAINPKQLDRFRDRFFPAGAKDDSRDATVLADALRTDPKAFRHLEPLDPVVVELREWSRIAEELTEERTRLVNRMSQQLWRYYPQFAELTDDHTANWYLDLWLLVPTPQHASRVRKTTLDKVLKRYRIRRFDAAALLDRLRVQPMTVAAGTTEAATAHIKTIVTRLALTNRQIADAYQQIDRITRQIDDDSRGQAGEQRDVTILASLPGLGRIVLATLLGEAAQPLQRRDYHALRCLCGIAPVTRQSGKNRIVTRRLAANRRLANALYHWARCAVQHDPVSHEKYAALRKRGHGHARALRSVSDRLLKVACTMLENQTTFDPAYPRQSAM